MLFFFLFAKAGWTRFSRGSSLPCEGDGFIISMNIGMDQQLWLWKTQTFIGLIKNSIWKIILNFFFFKISTFLAFSAEVEIGMCPVWNTIDLLTAEFSEMFFGPMWLP